MPPRKHNSKSAEADADPSADDHVVLDAATSVFHIASAASMPPSVSSTAVAAETPATADPHQSAAPTSPPLSAGADDEAKSAVFTQNQLMTALLNRIDTLTGAFATLFGSHAAVDVKSQPPTFTPAVTPRTAGVEVFQPTHAVSSSALASVDSPSVHIGTADGTARRLAAMTVSDDHKHDDDDDGDQAGYHTPSPAFMSGRSRAAHSTSFHSTVGTSAGYMYGTRATLENWDNDHITVEANRSAAKHLGSFQLSMFGSLNLLSALTDQSHLSHFLYQFERHPRVDRLNDSLKINVFHQILSDQAGWLSFINRARHCSHTFKQFGESLLSIVCTTPLKHHSLLAQSISCVQSPTESLILYRDRFEMLAVIAQRSLSDRTLVHQYFYGIRPRMLTQLKSELNYLESRDPAAVMAINSSLDSMHAWIVTSITRFDNMGWSTDVMGQYAAVVASVPSPVPVVPAAAQGHPIRPPKLDLAQPQLYCTYCKRPGHLAANCRISARDQRTGGLRVYAITSARPGGGPAARTCFKCGGLGHVSYECDAAAQTPAGTAAKAAHDQRRGNY